MYIKIRYIYISISLLVIHDKKRYPYIYITYFYTIISPIKKMTMTRRDIDIYIWHICIYLPIKKMHFCVLLVTLVFSSRFFVQCFLNRISRTFVSTPFFFGVSRIWVPRILIAMCDINPWYHIICLFFLNAHSLIWGFFFPRILLCDTLDLIVGCSRHTHLYTMYTHTYSCVYIYTHIFMCVYIHTHIHVCD